MRPSRRARAWLMAAALGASGLPALAEDEPTPLPAEALPVGEAPAADAATQAAAADALVVAEAASAASDAAPAQAAEPVPPPAEPAASAPDAGAAVDAAAAPADASPAPVVNPRDPFEHFNRSMYAFNDRIDQWVLRPAAEGYRRVVPDLVRTGIGNVFANIGDVWSAVNKLLQGKIGESAQMTLRVAVNTIFGLGGLLDPATEMRLERQSEDLGQTLGFWGVPSGPYLVLPIFGPSTLRDAVAMPADRLATSPTWFVNGQDAQISVYGLQTVNSRADLLGASRLLGDVALDPYAFLRDAYLARRRSQIYDGDPPDEPDDAPSAPAR